MTYALNRVLNLEDFTEWPVRATIREIFAHETVQSPDFPTAREHRKQWEIAMAVLALRDGGALRSDAEVLGIGAGREATLFWLTNHVRRVWATDLYAEPGVWSDDAPPTMLTAPGSEWDGPWNPRRLVVQHMDACDLAYDDESFDGIFSSGSIEHFGSVGRIATAMDEAFRVLKPGGTATFSTEFLIDGEPLQFENELVMFTPDLIQRVLLGERDWVPVSPIHYAVSDATLATEIEVGRYLALAEPVYPHCVLRIGPNLLTSVHIALRKADGRPVSRIAVPLATAAAAVEPASARVAAPPSPPPDPGRSPGGVATLPAVPTTSWESALKRVARRLARPVLSPIDGRVGDINRRIEFARSSAERHDASLQDQIDAVSRTVDAYTRSSSEASSYVGTELRRIHEVLEGVRDDVEVLQKAIQKATQRSLEEYYQVRLSGALGLSLDKLDGPLAQTINYATGNRGFYAQAGLWFNEPVWVLLSEGTASPVEVNERIVEIPFAMAALSRLEAGARILDVGSAESTFPLSAASLGYNVTAVDPRALGYSHPNIESHTSVLEDWDGPNESFQAAFLISTIEHVGLGAYGERVYGSPEHGAGADLALLERVRELLEPEGLLILTTPYGSREITELERIYDDAALTRLLANWEVLERRVAVRRDALVWEADERVPRGARGVMMVIASRTRPARGKRTPKS